MDRDEGKLRTLNYAWVPSPPNATGELENLAQFLEHDPNDGSFGSWWHFAFPEGDNHLNPQHTPTAPIPFCMISLNWKCRLSHLPQCIQNLSKLVVKDHSDDIIFFSAPTAVANPVCPTGLIREDGRKVITARNIHFCFWALQSHRGHPSPQYPQATLTLIPRNISTEWDFADALMEKGSVQKTTGLSLRMKTGSNLLRSGVLHQWETGVDKGRIIPMCWFCYTFCCLYFSFSLAGFHWWMDCSILQIRYMRGIGEKIK